MKHVIKVTQEHIDKAIAQHQYRWNVCDHCPIAQAAREQLNNPNLRVKLDDIYEPLTHKRYLLPQAGRNITTLPPEMWNTIVPTSFEVEEVEGN